MRYQTQGIVVTNRNIQSHYFLLEIDCPSIAIKIKPGQFIMLQVSEDRSPLLRRPFSIYQRFSMQDPDRKRRGRFSILYQKVGKGTHKMAEWRRGQKLDLIGPLGNGFRFPPPFPSAKIILIGGGVGIVPLYPLAQQLKVRPFFVFIGGKKADDLLCVPEFKKMNSTLLIATEDGSVGYKGTVIDLFLSQDKRGWMDPPPHLYACGPMPMLQALARVLKSKGISCQASLETRMACGFGACWGCVVKTKDPKVPYQRVCREGPIFHLEEIIWEP